MLVLARSKGSQTPSTAEIAEVVTLHEPTAKPSNLTATLRRLRPGVQPVRSGSKGVLRWRLRPGGVQRIESLTGLDLSLEAVSSNTRVVYTVRNLHPPIRDVTIKLIRDQHFSEAVGRAAKELNRMVRERTGRSRDEGIRMMHQVFSRDPSPKTRLLLKPITSDWQEDRQDGFRFMIAGAQQGIANVDKHGELEVRNETEAMEYLAFLSLLARLVDRAHVEQPA